MQIVSETNSLRTQILQWRREEQSIALVSTKGDVHEGHLALIREAAEHADVVVVSIFANHFEQDEINITPQVAEHDITTLKENGVTLVYIPLFDSLQIEQQIHLETPQFGNMPFAAFKQPSNYTQVFTTTVAKLLNLIQPDVICVGETCTLRQAIIITLVEQLCYPIKVVSVPTIREMDGLVVSRHNKKLTIDERQRASVLAKTLRWASSQIRGGRRDFTELLLDCKDQLRAAGLIPDEILIKDANNFHQVQEKTEKVVLFACVKLTSTTLFDNIVVDITPPPTKPTEEEEQK